MYTAFFACLTAMAGTAGHGADGVGVPDLPASPALGTQSPIAQSADIPAKTLFSSVKTPAPLEARAIGTYAKGCLAGGQRLPVDGPEWQAMRLSRNRNWGHPALLSYLERFAQDVRRLDGWPGLLVGDLSQPRGGPMESSHNSHQIGLDVDIWFTPMPKKRLSRDERETVSAFSVLLPGTLSVDPKIFTADHIRMLKRAASFGEVERIFVHPAIKKVLCETTASDPDRSWLLKMRPIWGHDDHFHVRIKCPEGTVGCQPQAPPPSEDGCGKELTDWFALLTAPRSTTQTPPPKPLTLDKLPADCRTVLSASRNSAIQPAAK